jgi:cytochrome c biogenesis protein CcdA/thiol-disulfide isomerase/thioredoxin
MALAIVLAFVAGLVTAVSPCVLPVLPIVLAGGVGANKRRPFAIIAGLAISFFASILFATWVLDKLGLPKDLLRNISIGLLFLIAIVLVVPQVGTWIEQPLSRLTRRPSGDLGGGFLLGCALGFVFVPCAGVALAYVTASAATGEFGLKSILVAVAYTVGVSLVLLAIAIGGRAASQRVRAGLDRFRIAFGALVAALAFVLVFHVDDHLANLSLPWTGSLDSLGKSHYQRGENIIKQREPVAKATAVAGNGLPDYGPAPDFLAISNWFNSPPLTLAKLRGKVVLIDFWTYSCINCLRTLPHLEALDRMYSKDGLVIVGVHTPEFAFEAVPSNVRAAIKRLGIRYPVALDPKYGTWDHWGNQYWPAEYLIDRNGHVRHAHFGEGEYDQTENTIRRLLGEKAGAPASTHIRDSTPVGPLTPESYLGYERLGDYTGSKIQQDKMAHYEFPKVLGLSQLSYAGNWRVERQRIVAGPGARLRLRFYAQDAYLVIGGKGRVEVLVDGKPKPTIAITADKLYTVAAQSKQKDTSLELRFSPGVDAYAFTFG